MKLYGDIPEADKVLIREMEELELVVDTNTNMDNLIKSKLYVCLAHDYMDLHIEEEMERLLNKAESATPGYFKEKAVKHAETDPKFAWLVTNLQKMLVKLASSKLESL